MLGLPAFVEIVAFVAEHGERQPVIQGFGRAGGAYRWLVIVVPVRQQVAVRLVLWRLGEAGWVMLSFNVLKWRRARLERGLGDGVRGGGLGLGIHDLR